MSSDEPNRARKSLTDELDELINSAPGRQALLLAGIRKYCDIEEYRERFRQYLDSLADPNSETPQALPDGIAGLLAEAPAPQMPALQKETVLQQGQAALAGPEKRSSVEKEVGKAYERPLTEVDLAMIASRVKPTELFPKLSPEEVEFQLRIYSGARTKEAAVIDRSDDAIVEMLQKGRYASLKSMMGPGGSKIYRTIITDTMKNKHSIFMPRKIKSWYAYLTEDNHGELGIKDLSRVLGAPGLGQTSKRGPRDISDLDLERLASEVNPGRIFPDLTADDIGKQLTIYAGESSAKNVTVGLSDRAIIDMLQKGTYWGSNQVKAAGSELSSQQIVAIFQEQSDVFDPKHPENRWFGYVTLENMAILGITSVPGCKKGAVVLEIGGDKLELKLSRDYTDKDVRDILVSVEPFAFGMTEIDNFIARYSRDGGVPGPTLITRLNEINGMLTVDSDSMLTYRQLERATGLPQEVTEGLLEEKKISARYVHTTNYFKRVFILEREMQSLAGELKIAYGRKYGVDIYDSELINNFMEWHRTLRDSGIMPDDSNFKLLEKEGVFDHSSLENMDRTYSAFQDAMMGYQFRDLEPLRLQMGGMSREQFEEGPMEQAIRERMARELIEFLGLPSTKRCHVVAGGALNDLYKMFDADPPTSQNF